MDSSSQKKRIKPDDMLDMGQFTHSHPIVVDIAYAKPDNLLFGEAIYKPDARLWVYKSLAEVVLRGAQICFEKTGYRYVLYDGLRTTTAQAKMLQTRRVKENMHWLEEPRLLSPPGGGGHPRGMAVDIGLMDKGGCLIDMGTPFDYLAEDAAPERNPAHRAHPYLSSVALENRGYLSDSFLGAAQEQRTEVFLLPQEWWDFRLPPHVYEQYEPLSDEDLPSAMQMV